MTSVSKEMFELFQESFNLLSDEDSWCKHVLCRPVHRDITESSQRCLLGSLLLARTTLESSRETYRKLVQWLSVGLPTAYTNDVNSSFVALSRLNDESSFPELEMWMQEKLNRLETEVTQSLA